MIADAVLRGWVVGYAAAAATAIVRAATRAHAPRAASDAKPLMDAVVLVRPLAGDEPGLAERLLETGGATFVLFAVGQRDDTAEPIAQHVAATLRSRGVAAVVVVTHAARPNHKADQLARALATPLARVASIVVVADSDVALADGDVERLADATRRADAVWVPPVERGPVLTWGDRASHAVLDASLHSFPLLAGIDPGGLVGKLFAVRRDALDEIGGFAGLSAHLGEDMELARRLRERGRKIAVAPGFAPSMAQARSLNDVLARYTRWLLVIRMQRPRLLLSYPLLLAPSPLLAVVVLLALSAHAPTLMTAAAGGLVVRVVIACAARHLAGLAFAPVAATVEALAGDLLLLIAAARACASNVVTWRGRRLELTRAGTLRAASGGKEPHEEALGETPDEARPTREDRIEADGRGGTFRTRTRGDRGVDASELLLDPLALPGDAARDVAGFAARERSTERDPELGVLAAPEHVAKADRNDERAPGDARDLRGAGSELERGERRALAAFGEHPERATGGIEQTRGVTDGARAVGGVVEVDPERADATEEGYASQVRRIHHRVAVAPEEKLGDVERDEGIPPRGVIGDEKERGAGDGGARGVEPRDLDATERAPDTRPRVAREPGIEPAALRGGDHGAPS